MNSRIKINITHKSYLRDPEATELGRSIISESIKLIDSLGFEHFTFKKLAREIGSTEASIYRYFENKQKLIIYLVSWYWAWLDYQIGYEINNITDPWEQLRKAMRVLSLSHLDNPASEHIDEAILHRIVIAEAAKSYKIKEVDDYNREGLFLEYKTVCKNISNIVLRIRPDYPYPHALISTIIEASHQQVFFSRHMPTLTEPHMRTENTQPLVEFLEHLLTSAINSDIRVG